MPKTTTNGRKPAPKDDELHDLPDEVVIVFPTTTAYESYIQRAVRARVEQLTRDYIRSHPEFTPERIAAVWMAFTIANAAEGSRYN